MTMNKREWLHRLPKAEYHVHIEGAIPWSMVQHTDGPDPLPDPVWLDPDFRFDDFNDFSRAMRASRQRVITSVNGYHRIARAHFQQLAAENVRYVEPSIHLAIAHHSGYDLSAIVEAITSAAPESLTVRVFAGFPRHALEIDPHFLERMVPQVMATPALAGIDVHSDERLGSLAPFREVYQEARQRGLRTKAHAGELCGAASIRDALDTLQPQRIQHGVTALEDEGVVERLQAEGIALDMAPISNWKLNVIPNMASHPIGYYYDYGIPVTVNTDDPAIFNCTLIDELLALVDSHVLTLPEVADIQREALRAADLPPAQLVDIEREIDVLLAELPT